MSQKSRNRKMATSLGKNILLKRVEPNLCAFMCLNVYELYIYCGGVFEWDKLDPSLSYLEIDCGRIIVNGRKAKLRTYLLHPNFGPKIRFLFFVCILYIFLQKKSSHSFLPNYLRSLSHLLSSYFYVRLFIIFFFYPL